MRILLSFISCLLITSSTAQVADSGVIELSAIKYSDTSAKKYMFLSTPKDSVAVRNIPFLHFSSLFPGRRGVPEILMERDCYVKFTLHNGGDTAREVFFIPGYYLKTFKLYSANTSNIAGSFEEVPEDTAKIKLFAGSKLIRLAPRQTKVYFGKFNFLRTNINIYYPWIIEKDFLWSWVIMNKLRLGYLNVITYLASGILLLMIFYSLAVYVQNRHREFIYYSAYVFCTGIMLFLKSFLDFKPTTFNLFFEEYLDFIIICIGVFFYLGFIRTFLNTGVREPFLEKMLRYAGEPCLY